MIEDTAKDHATAVERVIDLIHADHTVLLDIDTMTRVSHYSRFHFTRMFARYTATLHPPMIGAYGVTPQQYQRTVRCERAKKLLAKGMSVTEVAHAVGFGHHSSFTNRFTADVGMSPAAFRARFTTSRPAPRERGDAKSLDHAYRLVTTTRMAVGDIAKAVGYGSAGTFVTAFRRVYGQPPAAYRRERTRAEASAWMRTQGVAR